MPESRFYVYRLVRPWNGTPCYIGKGKNRRIHDHARHGEQHPNVYLGRIFRKAARLGMQVIAEKLREGLTEAEAFALEIELIKEIGRRPKGPLVNGDDGGGGSTANKGRKFSQEHRAKISAALKGHAVSAKNRAVASKTHKGKTLSSDHRAAISAAQMGNIHTLGFRHSEESLARMSAIKKGKPKTPEHRAKIGAAHRARSLSRKGKGLRASTSESLAIVEKMMIPHD